MSAHQQTDYNSADSVSSRGGTTLMFPSTTKSATRDLNSALSNKESSNLKVHTPRLNFRAKTFLTLLNQAERIKDHEFPLIITGPRGSGKSWLCTWMHTESKRAVHNYIRLNCEEYREDSTSANQAFKARLDDCLENAKNGTIQVAGFNNLSSAAFKYLSHKIAELESERSPDAPRLLLTASAVELDIDYGAELKVKVNILSLELPALSNRIEDLPVLCESFLEEFSSSEQNRKEMSVNALTQLNGYDWPGNIRELKNVLLAAVTNMPDNETEVQTVPLPAGKITEHAPFRRLEQGSSFQDLMQEYERDVLRMALLYCKGNQSMSSRLLKMNRGTMLKKMKLYNLLVL